jgi:hypothetical protein
MLCASIRGAVSTMVFDVANLFEPLVWILSVEPESLAGQRNEIDDLETAAVARSRCSTRWRIQSSTAAPGDGSASGRPPGSEARRLSQHDRHRDSHPAADDGTPQIALARDSVVMR